MKTLGQIFVEHPSDVQRVVAGGRASDTLFSALFDHFTAAGDVLQLGEDPRVWVEGRIHEITDSVEVHDRPEIVITYSHGRDGRYRFRQYLSSPVPPWATDVRVGYD